MIVNARKLANIVLNTVQTNWDNGIDEDPHSTAIKAGAMLADTKYPNLIARAQTRAFRTTPGDIPFHVYEFPDHSMCYISHCGNFYMQAVVKRSAQV